MKRARLTVAVVAAALVTSGALAGSAPARADDGGILGDLGKITGYVDQVHRFYDLFNQYGLGHQPTDLDAIKAAIVQSQQEIISQIDAIAAAQVQACAATAVEQFANVDQMSTDTLQAFAATSVACVNTAAADIGAESDQAAVDKTGFALNIVGPIALFASADANQRTDILRQNLIAANQLLLTRLKPTCVVSVLNPDDVPSLGEGGVTGHGVCFNYHVKAPPRVDGHVVWVAGPRPNIAYDPWYVRGVAEQIDDVFPNRGYDIFWPLGVDFSIPSDAVLGVTSAPIADAALTELSPAIGRWGSPIAAGAIMMPGALTEALRINDGSIARNEIRTADPTVSGWTQMDGRLRSLAAESNYDGRLEIFATDRLGRVFHRWQQDPGNETSWSPWALLTGQPISSLAVTRLLDGTLQLFGTDPAGRIFTRHQILGAEEINGVRTHDPAPPIDAWTDWTQMDGTLTQIAAAANADGQIELFGVNATGQVWDRRENPAGSWGLWNRLDGTLKTIAVTRDSAGSLDLFGTDMNGTVWTRRQTLPTTELWSTWTSLGGSRTWNVAAATERFSGRVDVLALDSHDHIWLTSGDPAHSQTWPAWAPVPDTPAAPPTVASPGPQRTTAGTDADLVLSITGGTAPYTTVTTGLPPGLAANNNHITGRPSTVGTFTVSVTPTDAVGTPGSPTFFTWTITGVPVPNVMSETLADAHHDLAAAGLATSASSRKACLDPGNVISQTPKGGAVVAAASTVRITIDSGTTSTCNLQ